MTCAVCLCCNYDVALHTGGMVLLTEIVQRKIRSYYHIKLFTPTILNAIEIQHEGLFYVTRIFDVVINMLNFTVDLHQM